MALNTGIDFSGHQSYKELILNEIKGYTMSLDKALENLKFDKRLVDLNIKMGRVTQVQMDQNTKSLEDLESQCEKLDLEKEDRDSN